MTKYLMAAILALTLALAGTGVLLKRLLSKNGEQAAQIEALSKAAKAAQEQRKRDIGTLARRAQKNAAMGRENALLRQQLDAALAGNPEWAGQPVPKEVQDALSK